MIRINLVQKKSSAGLTSLTQSPGAASLLQRIKDGSIFTRATDGRVPKGGSIAKAQGKEATRRLVIALALCGGCAYFAHDYLEGRKQAELDAVQVQIDVLAKKVSDLDKDIGKRAGFEMLKKQLDSDEKSVRTKIDVVKKLLDERPTISKLLLALSTAIPKDVWVSNFTWQDTAITISGSSIGTVVVTDFVKNLEETIFFRDVTLKSMKQTKDKGLDIATFDLEAKKK